MTYNKTTKKEAKGLKVSTKGRYAVRMLLDIALNQNGDPVPLKDIAARQHISKKYLEQIASQLTQAGIIAAVRGQAGGYRLIGAPETHDLYSILRVTEGPMHPVACLDLSPNECPRRDLCMTLPMWEGLDRVIRDYLSGITLQDLIDRAPTQSEHSDNC